MYCRSEGNLSSEQFNQACRYSDGAILTFLSVLKWFLQLTKAEFSGSKVSDTAGCPCPRAIFSTSFAEILLHFQFDHQHYV